MTAAPEIIVPIPALLGHQVADIHHPARFKVLRKGRRWGKDRLAFYAAWFGHGPEFCWPGILDGWDVAWLAPDFKQARILWQEEVRPRLDGVPGVRLNDQEHSATLSGCGSLYLFSAENVTSIRGLGKRLRGVIINEAAHLDLAYAWRDVIRPALMDNQGWALIMSTTNSGSDGGTDEQGNRRVPSYFNTLCEEIQTGKRGTEWMESWGTAEENPKIGPTEFRSLVSEYPVDSVSLEQEVYAKLLAPGKGLAFPEWREDRHVIPTFTVPRHWELGAGFDWGYWDPSALVLTATGEEGNTVVLGERRWVQKDGFTIGEDIGKWAASLDRELRSIAADASTWDKAAKKGYPNQAEEIQAGIHAGWTAAGRHAGEPWLAGIPRIAGSRVQRVSLLHRYLKVPDDGTPRIRFLKNCTHCTSTIPRLPPDPRDPEDVDTKSDDHFYDALTYFLMSRPPIVDALPVPREENRHPGLEARYKKQLQAMGLIPGGDGKPKARYRAREMRRL